MKTEKMKIISPIAIDMGAKNTGVYYAQYEQGSSFEEIEKQGQVLVYDKYTALLKERTANRHVRRGYQRKKLAKRLLVLVLENCFDFPAKEHNQAIGFLLNRRGFTFLDEQYSKEHLDNFPDKAWCELSKDIQNILERKENIAERLIDLSTNEPETITEIFNAIQEIEGYKKFHNTKEKIKKEFVYFDYIEKINSACDFAKKGEVITDDKVKKTDKDKKKLSETANWVIKRLNKEKGLDLTIDDNSYQTSLIKQITPSNYQQLQQNLPNFEEERNQIKNKQAENNKSPWNFNVTKFEFNDKNETGLAEVNAKIQLHHFCYAIYKINDEITSGARHRSKYFAEIGTDLVKFTSDDFLANKHSPEYLKAFAKELKDNKQLSINKLHNLVCHISNLELKPLRAYFNDKTPINKSKENKDRKFESHKKENGGDKFNNEKLSRLVSIWFLKNWRVNEGKDNSKKVEEYGKLRKAWQEHVDKDDVVKFWLKTCPILTIPPYQSMNNRKPPKCQTLLLNGDYLNNHYPKWKAWLELLKLDSEYPEKLQSLKSGKGSQLISDDLIKLRQLQFILDTAKKQDQYKFNEIWSIHHKLQQLKDSGDAEEIEKWKERLNKAKKDSELPSELKQILDFEKQRSFGHFINKYYQDRRKTKNGRYFLIQEKKEKWLTDDCLLILCTHKPRQKKYQWQIDLAAVLGIDKQALENELKDKDKKEMSPEDYFKDIKGACEKATKAQKKYRGELKTKIDSALAQLRKVKKPPKGDAKDLSDLADRCDKLKTKLIERMDIDGLFVDKQSKKTDQKIALVFKFAQINNIVFKDRNGFSKTCPVCSTDNGFRMQENKQGIVNASRLPALSIRLIDGVVMRICDAVSRQVATTKWNEIKEKLKQGKKISIPLIMEQNRFEFEPSLAKIKNKKKDLTDNRDKEYTDKETRIKQSAQRICAYTGTSLGDDGEIDHIIPQASRYGTLNDEANLIYVSNLGNQDKGKQSKFLKDLSSEYKDKIFEGKTDDEIQEFIYKKLEGKDAEIGVVGNEDYFEFGRYLSFINLSIEQQKAFRHALFLPDNDPLKQKVVRALQNRNRAIVNGTQRYLAQCIADKIYKIARKEGREKQIEFDYFEYTAREDVPNSTYNLRRFYENRKAKLLNGNLLVDIAKISGEKQKIQSHLIDAQMAFLLAANEHRDAGSMSLKFEHFETITKAVDVETGEILPSNKFFELSQIKEEEFSPVDLNPKTSNQKITDIEKKNSGRKQDLSNTFNRYVFKQNAIGEKYLPIVEFNEKLYLGYAQTKKGGIYNVDEYCTEITDKPDMAKFKEIIKARKYYELTTNNEQIKIWTIKVIDKRYKQIDKDSHKYFSNLSQQYTEDEKENIKHILLIIKKCKKYTQKTNVTNAPSVLSKDNNKKMPLYKMWVDFDRKWKNVAGNEYRTKDGEYLLDSNDIKKKWNEFCKKQFSSHKNQSKNKHAKVHKFTMNAVASSSGNVFRINRCGEDIYQAVPLDNNIISKDRSNFLIQHSKNLTLVSKTVDKDLSKGINAEVKETGLKNHQIKSSLFFKNDFFNKLEKSDIDKIRIFLNYTSVDIKNFPLDKFKLYFDSVNDDDKGKIFDKKDKKLHPIKELNIKDSIEVTPRNDKSVVNIEINNDTDKVNFSLPFKSDAIEKFFNSVKENG